MCVCELIPYGARVTLCKYKLYKVKNREEGHHLA